MLRAIPKHRGTDRVPCPDTGMGPRDGPNSYDTVALAAMTFNQGVPDSIPGRLTRLLMNLRLARGRLMARGRSCLGYHRNTMTTRRGPIAATAAARLTDGGRP